MQSLLKEIKVKKLNEEAIIPCYGRIGDAGLDLFTLEEIIINKNDTVVIPTGVAFELPANIEGSVRPRSGISLNGCKNCFDLEGKSCSPYLRVQIGTIDSNYRGDIGIITYNQENYSVKIPKHTKLAQLVISPVIITSLKLVDDISSTNREYNGFGSSGLTI
ncbi:MAG: dUTP diphosphatase [Romboutsia sp.]